MVGGDFGHGDGPSVIGREFDLVTVAAFIDMNDRSNIAHGKPVVGKVGGQRHAIQLFDHAGRGYAVMKRYTITAWRLPQHGLARLIRGACAAALASASSLNENRLFG